MKGYRIGRGTLYLGGTFSIHTLREEGDAQAESRIPPSKFSIHTLREEGDRLFNIRFAITCFFLSTPSARRATVKRRIFSGAVCFSIHTLREEGDPRAGYRGSEVIFFLSTPSARRATAVIFIYLGRGNFLSTPSARRATGSKRRQPSPASRFSIHTLREEGDFYRKNGIDGWIFFLSTPSARRATAKLHKKERF